MKIISYHHSLSDCDSNDNCTTNLRRCRYDAAINALSAEIIASLFYNLLMEFPLLILEFIIISVA